MFYGDFGIKIVVKIFGKWENKSDICTRKTGNTGSAAAGNEKKMQKSSKKIWWFKKKVLSLHHFPLEKSGMLKKDLILGLDKVL